MKRWLCGSWLVLAMSACGPDLAGLAEHEEGEQPVSPGGDAALPELDGGQATVWPGAQLDPSAFVDSGLVDAALARDAAFATDAALLTDAGLLTEAGFALDASLAVDAAQPVVDASLPVSVPPFSLTSPAFNAGERLPASFTCVGGDASPPLTWSAGPPGTASYVLTLSTPPAGFDPRPNVQWVLWNIPASARGLPQSVAVGPDPANVPGAKQAGSSAIPLLFPNKRYKGPCGLGFPQQYDFTLYALRVAALPPVSPLAEPDQVLELVTGSGTVLAKTTLTTHFP